MDKIVVEGGRSLSGRVTVSGSKNSALPILAATLLSEEPSVIENVPQLRDVNTMLRILRELGVRVQADEGRVTVEPGKYKNFLASYKLVKTMRASFCVLGPLLAKHGRAQVSLPGGCVIGPRPIDLHLKGMKALGAKIKIDAGYVHAEAKKLRGTVVYLGGTFGSSVLATANVMMAATLARGRTVIENAAVEPEVVDLAEFLLKMGAKIKGHNTHVIEIEGVKKLNGAKHRVIADRIEAGSFIAAGLITGSEITVRGADISHLAALMDKIRETGGRITRDGSDIKVRKGARLKAVNVATLPYPGFPTDMQAQFMALMCLADGISVITEKVYPDRFMHISELNRMGADINLEGSTAIVKGARRLSGAPVIASDLRASAALVLAGLVANGRTDISRAYHLDRGYEKLDEKLSRLGARIWREKED